MIESSTRPWPIRALDEVATVTAGQSAPQEPVYFGGTNRFVRVSHLDAGSDQVVGFDFVTDAAINDLGLKEHPAGTIVFPKSGASVRLEKRALLPFDAYLVSHLAAVRGDPAIIDQDFLFFALRFHRFSDGKASGYPTLKLSEIRAAEVPVPPLPEQQAIARILRTVQRAKEATEQAIGAGHALKKSLSRHLLCHGLIPPAEAPHVELTTDSCPPHWEVKSVGEIADVMVSSAGESALSKVAEKTDDERVRVLYLKVSDLAAGGPRYVERSATEFSVPSSAPSALKLVPIGSTVFPKRGAAISTNRKRQNLELSALDPNLVAVVAHSADPDFLFLWFEDYDLRALVPPDVIPQINKKDIAPLRIAVPPREEQARIVEAFEAVSYKVAAEEARRDAISALFGALLQNLITAKIRLDEGPWRGSEHTEVLRPSSSKESA